MDGSRNYGLQYIKQKRKRGGGGKLISGYIGGSYEFDIAITHPLIDSDKNQQLGNDVALADPPRLWPLKT